MKVYSYVRFSSKKQEHGASRRRQSEKALEYCKRHGLTLEDDDFSDLGVSAWKGENFRNGALGAFLEAVDAGRIPSDSMLLVEHLDRVSRAEPLEAIEIFTAIINRGLTLVTLKDDQVYSRATIKQDWTKLLKSVIEFVGANEANEDRSVRVKDGLAKSRAAGLFNARRLPVWLRLSADRKHLHPIPERVEVVQQIFAWADEGSGAHVIAKRLNQQGTPIYSQRRVKNREKPQEWTAGTVAQMLRSIAVMGHMQQSNGVVVQNYYQHQVISPAMFYRVRDGVARRAKIGQGRRGDAEVRSLVNGLLRCACGVDADRKLTSKAG